MSCLFCRIIAGEVPAKKIYEDDTLVAFHDINPQAPVHVLVVPRRHIATLNDLGPEDDTLVGTMLGKGNRHVHSGHLRNRVRATPVHSLASRPSQDEMQMGIDW